MPNTVLITGGARGIGRAIADDLVRDHQIALSYFSDKTPGKIFVCKHPGALAIRADFRDANEPAELIRMVVSAFGQIDAIVNAAMLSTTSAGPIDPARQADIDQVNEAAPAALLTAALPHMPKGSAVLNIAPRPAEAGTETNATASTKIGLDTRTLARHGIRSNTIVPAAAGDAPGAFTATARYLLSKAAAGVTGMTVTAGRHGPN